MGRQPPIVIPLAPVLGEGPWVEWLKHELAAGPLAPDVSLALHRAIDRWMRRQTAEGAPGDPPSDGRKESP